MSRHAQSLDLPLPPTSLLKTIGPSFILLGLALGSGELILWPYLVANYGLGLLWGGLLGITLQYFLNTEVLRYALATGESVFVGFRKLSRIIPLWYIISTVIPWSLPGFASTSANIFHHAFPWLNPAFVTVFLLFLTGTILTVGKQLYKTMERLQTANVFIGLSIVIFFVSIFAKPEYAIEIFAGLVGRGNDWWFFPAGIGIFSFLGAFAYSGAGGNLNLAQSYYIKEKGFGMGAYSQKITSLFAGGAKPIALYGNTFTSTKENAEKWKQWWHMTLIEHAIVFWGMGLLTIILLSLLARSLTFGMDVQSGISFVFLESEVIGQRLGSAFATTFLIMAGLMMFTTQTGILESSSRIISENVLLFFSNKKGEFPLSKAFYIALWTQIIAGSVVYSFGFREPRLLLTLGAVLNAGAMMVSFPLMYILNKTKIPAMSRVGSVRGAILGGATICFALFLGLTLYESFFK
ncbi:MAG TPA: hypothetical protein DCW55_00225 [Candidatus Pacebacteria bacterium]|nr:MAG: hypothetical protein A2378_02865 [Candidatus Pacebacteria bacterium RIFOXYB1_FULL_44_10]HAU98641.1 hypothetical protein [Candidatus Paceibacterota bacterium]HAX01933.1 hypothetical protein [Candidatus Paceibacterota bacterium]